MFKNDERYWDINLLNKWFAISSIIFLACTIWLFIDDNDDEFKDYQREFRNFKEAYEFYLQREDELGDIWKNVVMIETTSRVIDPELYSSMKISY